MKEEVRQSEKQIKRVLKISSFQSERNYASQDTQLGAVGIEPLLVDFLNVAKREWIARQGYRFFKNKPSAR